MERILFDTTAIVNADYFDEEKHGGSLGYFGSSRVTVTDDGKLILTDSEDSKDIYYINKALMIYSNINNYDPQYVNAVKLIFEDSALMITFNDAECKLNFCKCISGNEE